MLEGAVLHRKMRFAFSLIEYGVADITIRPDLLARVAEMLAVVTAKTTEVVEVSDVVRVSPPIDFHLREEISLKDPLQLCDGALDRFLFAGVHIRIIPAIVVIKA